MKLYIKIKDGIPEGHPVLEENLISAFPEIDVNNLPDNWKEFERIPARKYGVYEVYVGCEYEFNSETGLCQDKHIIRQMTDSEKLDRQEEIKANWNNGPTSQFHSWVFNPDTCTYEPPVLPPEKNDPNEQWLWKESELKWIPMPTKPTDDKNYYLDIIDASWKELV
jgi:hypothetical protein